jgi:hypothetical protein
METLCGRPLVEDEEDVEKKPIEKAAHSVGIVLGAAGVLIVMVGLITAAILVHGFVLKLMWAWFLVPLGLPALGLAHACGLGLLARYLTWQRIPKSEEDEDANARRLALNFIYPCIILGFGSIIHTFV